jgi:predicted enzyme related to lactoylglutathione lyase
MLERSEYPPGVPCWVDTSQPDPEAATRFYEGLFGWEFEDRMPADAPGNYFVAKLHGRDVAAVGSQMEGSPPTPVWNTYIAVDSADDTAAKITKAGGSVLAEPFDVMDAGRMAIVSDPSGAVFSLWQANQTPGAQLVNEAGTWNFSDLNTRDVDAATAFYGEVFGWVAGALEGGGTEFTFLRLPGYGDFLERSVQPGLRAGQEEAGAPPEFADVVAGMATMTRDRFPDDVPPHWSVTFAVDDADVTAARAEELGGALVAPPMDAGPTRIAIVRDPQGVAFTASRFYPERL